MCNGRINLVNIDFHHDMFNDSDEVNCGNWLSHIVREYDGRFTWVAREDSFQIDKKLSKKVKIITNPLDLDSLSEIRWDLIYICRSDMWCCFAGNSHVLYQFLQCEVAFQGGD